MKKRALLFAFILALSCPTITVQAAGKEKTFAISQYADFLLKEVTGTSGEDPAAELKESVEQLIQNVKLEDAEKLLQFIEEKLEEGKWESEDGIEEAIAEGEETFDTTLTKDQKEKILSIVSRIKKLGIAPEYILEQAKKLYEKYGEELTGQIADSSKEIAKNTQDKIKEEIDRSMTDYFSDMVDHVKTFFKGIFSK